jgi:sulfotransferase
MYYFDCGLPRSGSTLLSAILNQNPEIYAGPFSPVLEVMNDTNLILAGEQASLYPKPIIFDSMVSGVIENYYSDRIEKTIIDKCRAWPAHIDLIEKYITSRPKLLCTIRNPLEILASFIELINRSETVSFVDKAILDKGEELTDESRCDFLMMPGGVVGESIYALNAAIKAGRKSCIHYIWYDKLVSNPDNEIKSVYQFLQLTEYPHDFDNIVDDVTNSEGDADVYGLPTMHDVRKTINKISKPYTDVLNDMIIEKYTNLLEV